ncbi:MAG: hypothetical protein Q4E17_03820 [Synergistes sp.]|nr:hypothetical protein [Synergistes sp.]
MDIRHLLGKFTKRNITVLAVLAFLTAGAFYLWHDLRLAYNFTKELPDIVVENIEIEREIKGRKCKLSAPYVEHRKGTVYAKSVDIRISEAEGKTTEAKAASGKFVRDTNNASLGKVEGFYKDREKVCAFSSGAAEYNAESGVWKFSEGVMLDNGSVVVEGEKGSYNNEDGICHITGGGVVTWRGNVK